MGRVLICLKHPFQDRKYNCLNFKQRTWKSQCGMAWFCTTQKPLWDLSKSHLSVSILFKCSVVLDLNIELFQKRVCVCTGMCESVRA